MILSVGSFRGKNLTFSSNKKEDDSKTYEHDTLLKNDFATRTRIDLDKLTKAFTIYPAKGLKGSKNANFYEFLTMGNVPYIVGSLTLMSVFNSASPHFLPYDMTKAKKLGNKMALGVILYALFKSVSKSFVNFPVKLITGIDTELPYAKVNYLLQEDPDSYENLTSIEYHKVGESVDFPRWDQLYGDPKKGEKLNFRYDKIAKKNGLGENLNDSDQEVKPFYKEVLVKSKLAKSFSSYLWAAVGVALAFQKPWEDYFRIATLKFWKGKDFIHSLKVLGNSFVDSVKSLYKGSGESFVQKHSGKALLGFATLVTALGVINTIHITKKPSSIPAIDPNKESMVS